MTKKEISTMSEINYYLIDLTTHTCIGSAETREEIQKMCDEYNSAGCNTGWTDNLDQGM